MFTIINRSITFTILFTYLINTQLKFYGLSYSHEIVISKYLILSLDIALIFTAHINKLCALN